MMMGAMMTVVPFLLMLLWTIAGQQLPKTMTVIRDRPSIVKTGAKSHS